jgi:hypothetical protein
MSATVVAIIRHDGVFYGTIAFDAGMADEQPPCILEDEEIEHIRAELERGRQGGRRSWYSWNVQLTPFVSREPETDSR